MLLHLCTHTHTQEVGSAIDAGLVAAREENAKLSSLMAELGLSSRPTVAQWLTAKNKATKTSLQSTLIQWDRMKSDRQTALLLKQAVVSQRALKHASWGARKEMSQRIRLLRHAYQPHTLTPSQHRPRTESGDVNSGEVSPRQPVVKHKNKVPLRSSANSSGESIPSCYYANIWVWAVAIIIA